MPKKVCFLVSFLLLAFIFAQPVNALVCTSPKKSAVGASPLTGTTNFFYTYQPYSWSQRVTPMLKRGHIAELRRNPDPNTCSLAGCKTDTKDETNCCPAKMIKKTIQDRGPGGYWLIFNEPFGEDQYGVCTINGQTIYWPCKSVAAAQDAALAISTIKAIEAATVPNSTIHAQFIVGWYTDNERFPYNDPSHNNEPTKDIIKRWPAVIDAHPGYGLNRDMNQEIAGWHIHPYGLTYETRNIIINHPVRIFSPTNKELWLTEFNTVGLSKLPSNPCRYDNIDTDFGQTCIPPVEKLLNWLESAESPVTRYFWWYGLSCGGYKSDGTLKDGCVSPLLKTDGTLNKLGEAFAKIPNDNGICRYGTSPTPTPTRTPTPTATVTPRPTASPSPTLTLTPTPFPCPLGLKGDLNCDLKINEADLTILSASWGPAPSPQPGYWPADLNGSGTVDITDLNILLSYWEVI